MAWIEQYERSSQVVFARQTKSNQRGDTKASPPASIRNTTTILKPSVGQFLPLDSLELYEAPRNPEYIPGIEQSLSNPALSALSGNISDPKIPVHFRSCIFGMLAHEILQGHGDLHSSLLCILCACIDTAK